MAINGNSVRVVHFLRSISQAQHQLQESIFYDLVILHTIEEYMPLTMLDIQEHGAQAGIL